MQIDTIDSNKLNNIAQILGFRSYGQYKGQAEFLFEGISFCEKTFLDIGCGNGAFALWAGINGGKYVLGIEPESSGSTKGSLEIFRGIVSDFGLQQRVQADNKFLQDIKNKTFDIILMHNVINHLDEEAVQRLHFDSTAQKKYVKILTGLRKLITNNGQLIIADCGRYNFWNMIGLKSPFAPGIEWEKHQQPKVWIPIFEQAGFGFNDLRWRPVRVIGKIGANKLFHFFTITHFVIRFHAKQLM
jgi:SAM-dependent methyltransferase